MPTPVPTPAPAPQQDITCLIWGDPHIVTFDIMGLVRRSFWNEQYRNWNGQSHWGLGGHTVPDFFRSGVYWLVKSEQVKIQAYYGLQGGWQLHALALGGEFLGGRRLVIDRMHGGNARVLWEGQEVSISTEWSNSLARVSVTRSSQGQLKQMLVSLPAGVRLKLNRDTWNSGRSANVNAYIKMLKQPEQDGHCGRADGSFAEDEFNYLYTYWGNEVDLSEQLFDSENIASLLDAHQERSAYNPQEVCANSPPLPDAEAACTAALEGSPTALADALRPGCLVDVCALGLEAADVAKATVTRTASAIQEALPPNGWYDGGERMSCDEGCNALGLVCTEEQLLAHNGDVDTTDKVLQKIAEVGGKTNIGVCDPQWGEADDVPNWSAGGCHESSPSRAISTFNCAATPRGGLIPKHRLCYCHALTQGTAMLGYSQQ